LATGRVLSHSEAAPTNERWQVVVTWFTNQGWCHDFCVYMAIIAPVLAVNKNTAISANKNIALEAQMLEVREGR